jgi:dGTPase
MVPTELFTSVGQLRGCLAHRRTETGRRRHINDEDLLPMYDQFASDEARLESSKSFRLLSHKTQVVTGPENPLVRNRATHVLEVVACSVVLADLLGLNTSLARAIAFGHDIGHVPFGHPGEHFLAEAMGRPEFCHEVMGPIVAQKIERRGRGLNLTFETLDGMMRHSGNKAREDMTQEAWVVRYTDKIAYIFHDYNDLSERMRHPLTRPIHSLMREFGTSQRERTCAVMAGLIAESAEKGKVSFEDSPLAKKFHELRSLMMGIYTHVTQQDLRYIMEPVLRSLEEFALGDPFLLFALMTDRDTIFLFNQRSRNIEHLQHTALKELLPYLEDIGEVDLCDPDLSW